MVLEVAGSNPVSHPFLRQRAASQIAGGPFSFCQRGCAVSGGFPMQLMIGTDEAGYGPNLGPLVVTATAWRAMQAWRSLVNPAVPPSIHW